MNILILVCLGGVIVFALLTIWVQWRTERRYRHIDDLTRKREERRKS